MKYKVGDKVVPINGSEAASLDSITSKMQEYNKKYLKVSKYASQGDRNIPSVI